MCNLLKKSCRLRSAGHKRGYLTLITVLIVAAIGIAASLTVLTLGIGVSQGTTAYDDLHEGRALANACAEEALQAIRAQTSFTGNGNLTLGTGTCTYAVTNSGEENRTVNTEGRAGDSFIRLRVELTSINPELIVSSWQEVAI
jgi:hypothetical protein